MIWCYCTEGLDQMVDENRIEDLTLFYQLLSRVHHGLKELCTGFAAYIKVRGLHTESIGWTTVKD